MALQLRPNCEYCDKDLPPNAWTRGFAPMNARSAPSAWRRNCTMYARTAAVVSRGGRSAHRMNGGQACRFRDSPRRRDVCI